MGYFRYESAGPCKPEGIGRLISYLAPAGDDVTYRETAAQLNMSQAAVKAAVYRLRRRYRALLRGEIARTVATEDQVAEEIQCLFGAPSRRRPHSKQQISVIPSQVTLLRRIRSAHVDRLL